MTDDQVVPRHEFRRVVHDGVAALTEERDRRTAHCPQTVDVDAVLLKLRGHRPEDLLTLQRGLSADVEVAVSRALSMLWRICGSRRP